MREPLGLFGTLGMPIIVFSSSSAGSLADGLRVAGRKVARIVGTDVAHFAALLIATGAVLSLVTIISIYREAAS